MSTRKLWAVAAIAFVLGACLAGGLTFRYMGKLLAWSMAFQIENGNLAANSASERAYFHEAPQIADWALREEIHALEAASKDQVYLEYLGDSKAETENNLRVSLVTAHGRLANVYQRLGQKALAQKETTVAIGYGQACRPSFLRNPSDLREFIRQCDEGDAKDAAAKATPKSKA